jgi:dienelactone hydrolase
MQVAFNNKHNDNDNTDAGPDARSSRVLSRRQLHRLVAAMAGTVCLPGVGADKADEADKPAPGEPVERLPLAAFAQLPRMQHVELSPDGRHIACLINLDDTTVLVTRAVTGDGALTALLKTDNQRFHFRWLAWVGNDRVVASVRYASDRFQVDVTETRLLSVGRDGSNLTVLSQRRETSQGRMNVQLQDRVIDWMPRDGQHILLAAPEGTRGYSAVYKLDVLTGKRSMVQVPRQGVGSWMTDAQHRVRIGVMQSGLSIEIVERPVDGAFRTLWRFERYTPAEAWPLGFGANPQELWVQAWHEGYKAIFTVDLADPALPRTLRLARPGVDLDGELMRSPVTQEVIGLQHVLQEGEGEQRADIWSPDENALVLAIDRQLPRRFNRLASFSQDAARYVVRSSGNGQPAQYYIGDRAAGTLTLLTDTYPGLPARLLVGKKAVRIQARDGLVLQAWLSRPRGATGPLPLVLLPHGGPQAYDNADFDLWTELLANRGMLVLQVNFRGSAGGGIDHRLAGLKRWGLEMQDDLTDAAQWAITQQLADPARIAIVGGSYGGYAALMGVVKTPALFRCAVSFAGVGDLQALVTHQAFHFGGAADMEAQVGRIWGDGERLRATSPLQQVARIQAPMLLAHGSADAVVPVSQSRDMAQALKQAGKRCDYLELDGGDHHLSRQSHRLAFFGAMEAFLAEHLTAG